MNLAEFRRALRLEGMSGIEEKWLVLIESPEIDTDLALDVINMLLGEIEKKQASDFMEMLVVELLNRESFENALKVLKRVAEVFPTNKMLRERLVTCYKTLYADDYDIEKIIDETGLRARHQVKEALKQMELFLTFKAGDAIQHRSWGLGVVSEVDIRGSALIVDFANRKGHRFDLQLAASALMIIPAEGFKAKLVKDPEGLQTMAEENPVEVVKLLLTDIPDGVNMRDLRKHLEGHAIPADSWSRWWGKARRAILGDPYIEATKGGAPILKLRAEAFDPSQQALATARSRANVKKKITEISAILKRVTRPKERVGTLKELVVALRQLHDAQPARSALRFGITSLADNVGVLCADVKTDDFPREVPESADEMVAWLMAIPLREHRVSLLDACRAAAGEHWQGYLWEVILKGTNDVRDSAIDELNGLSPDAVESVIYELFSSSELYFEAFISVGRMVLYGRVDCPPAYSLTDVYRILATGTNRLRSGLIQVEGGADDVFKQARALLIDQKILRRVIEVTPEPEIGRLIALIESLRRLDDRPLRMLEGVVHELRPHVLLPAPREGEINENIILTTNAGLAVVRRDFDHIMQEDLPKIAQELGHAISLGDVSDNAEYRSARQRQQDLVYRAKRMREDIARASVVAPGEVKTDRVGFGAEVEVTDLDADERSVKQILGPWDADPTQNVISYLSPLGRGFWGSKAGDEVTIDVAGTKFHYRIDAIRVVPALQADDED